VTAGFIEEVSSLNRKEKEQIVSYLSEKVKGHQAVVLTNYRGLNVEQINRLRRRLREEKISYHVVKNTLMKFVSLGSDLEKLNGHFEGPTAIAISHGDPVLLAKVLSEFLKTQPSFEIKAGLIQGRLISPEEVKGIATMPSREALLAQVLGGIQMAGTQLGAGILAVLQQVVGVIQARVDQLAESENVK
jgi:large subunit ribosomal protein L10